MEHITKTTTGVKAVGSYSLATIQNGSIQVSGQIALTPEGKLRNKRSITEETTQVMKNLSAILEAASADFSAVTKTTIYLTDVTWYAEVNEVYGTFMQEPYPARVCVGVKELPLGARVEIAMDAAAPNNSKVAS
jgi:2-iminobutanoate/2-iminopropanoate deaminase